MKDIQLWRIEQKINGAWTDEHFLSGGVSFIQYKKAQETKKKIENMCCSILYRVKKFKVQS